MDGSVVEAVARELSRARRVLFVTGAGISADSGLPTYRGVGGLYETELPEGMSIEEILSAPTLHRDPALCWRYIGEIERACRGARPNRGHEVVAALQDRCEVVVLTQNVDGLHRRAGSRDVIEIHGTIHTLRCTGCRWRTEVEDYAALTIPPTCPACGGPVRPDVVLFGEMLPHVALRQLHLALERPFDIVFTVGTTSVFPYIAAPVVQQARAGRATVEINPGRSEVSAIVGWRMVAGAAEALEALWRIVG